ncbi:hypothetical protein [Agromyces indicus]|uniref:Uncharacterized protein n=1 Tax=Agromyces indicus TaxID=758919 RepID=A0ABU1FJR2_9MICO|nr:hypothetical protein [Agromyces indicus]MDR5691631.1 hypothetical protein [Agromyces indicus]
MDWLWTAGLLVVGMVVFGSVLAMRHRRDRSAGTEGQDLWEDAEAWRRRDDPDVREWDHRHGP